MGERCDGHPELKKQKARETPLARTYPMVQCIDEVDVGSGLFLASPRQWTVVEIAIRGGADGEGESIPPPPSRTHNETHISTPPNPRFALLPRP
ncbi:hypothetical protein MBOURGENBZM_02450 [Methanoculleus bourgensis]|nr:hypothetical protein MBOURGENBZM_02450 [Methanoculleus bourgensis]